MTAVTQNVNQSQIFLKSKASLDIQLIAKPTVWIENDGNVMSAF